MVLWLTLVDQSECRGWGALPYCARMISGKSLPTAPIATPLSAFPTLNLLNSIAPSIPVLKGARSAARSASSSSGKSFVAAISHPSRVTLSRTSSPSSLSAFRPFGQRAMAEPALLSRFRGVGAQANRNQVRVESAIYTFRYPLNNQSLKLGAFKIRVISYAPLPCRARS